MAETQRVTNVYKDGTKIYPVILNVVNVPLVMVMLQMVPLHAIVSLPAPTVGTVEYKNVIQVIIVKVKPPIKPLAHQDHTPPELDPLHALNAHPERMPPHLVPYLVKIVTPIPTNLTPTLQNAFQCKKGTTNRVPQHKWFVQPVKQAVVVVQHVNNARLEHSKPSREAHRA